MPDKTNADDRQTMAPAPTPSSNAQNTAAAEEKAKDDSAVIRDWASI